MTNTYDNVPIAAADVPRGPGSLRARIIQSETIYGTLGEALVVLRNLRDRIDGVAVGAPDTAQDPHAPSGEMGELTDMLEQGTKSAQAVLRLAQDLEELL